MSDESPANEEGIAPGDNRISRKRFLEIDAAYDATIEAISDQRAIQKKLKEELKAGSIGAQAYMAHRKRQAWAAQGVDLAAYDEQVQHMEDMVQNQLPGMDTTGQDGD